MDSNNRYIVRAAEIAELGGYRKVHFLNDNAQRVNKSLGDLTGLSSIGFHVIEVAPGHRSTEQHVHHHEEECVFILSGEAHAVIGDEVHRVRPGDFIGYRAGGHAHTLINTGTEVLRCIVAGQRLDHDVADYPAVGKRLYRNEKLPWNLVDHDAIETVDAGRKK